MKYLNFSEDFTEKILKGEKRATLRLGTKDYREGEIVTIKAGNQDIGKAKIVRVRRVHLYDLRDEDIKLDGYENFDDLLKDLQRFYPDMKEDDLFTQIIFKLIS